jgi:hypothetical protein
LPGWLQLGVIGALALATLVLALALASCQVEGRGDAAPVRGACAHGHAALRDR